jgi:hypothetical protein
MTDKEFCDLYNSYTGEGSMMSGIDSLTQLKQHTFNGEELKEFIEHCISQYQHTQYNPCSNCKDDPCPGRNNCKKIPWNIYHKEEELLKLDEAKPMTTQCEEDVDPSDDE